MLVRHGCRPEALLGALSSLFLIIIGHMLPSTLTFSPKTLIKTDLTKPSHVGLPVSCATPTNQSYLSCQS